MTDEDPTIEIPRETLAEVAALWRATLEQQRLVEPKEQSNG